MPERTRTISSTDFLRFLRTHLAQLDSTVQQQYFEEEELVARNLPTPSWLSELTALSRHTEIEQQHAQELVERLQPLGLTLEMGEHTGPAAIREQFDTTYQALAQAVRDIEEQRVSQAQLDLLFDSHPHLVSLLLVESKESLLSTPETQEKKPTLTREAVLETIKHNPGITETQLLAVLNSTQANYATRTIKAMITKMLRNPPTQYTEAGYVFKKDPETGGLFFGLSTQQGNEDEEQPATTLESSEGERLDEARLPEAVTPAPAEPMSTTSTEAATPSSPERIHLAFERAIDLDTLSRIIEAVQTKVEREFVGTTGQLKQQFPEFLPDFGISEILRKVEVRVANQREVHLSKEKLVLAMVQYHINQKNSWHLKKTGDDEQYSLTPEEMTGLQVFVRQHI